MRDSSESKRLWRTALIVAGVGLLVLAPLSWLALRMYDDTVRRRVIAANESTALGTLEAIQAAEQLYYAFALKVQPKTETQPAAYTVNADPVRAGDDDATGRRHFFISSDVIGVRFNETRPATKDDKLRPTMKDY
jgi:hypothetical protein